MTSDSKKKKGSKKRTIKTRDVVIGLIVAPVIAGVLIAYFSAFANRAGTENAEALGELFVGEIDPSDPFGVAVHLQTYSLDYGLPEPLDEAEEFGPLVSGDVDEAPALAEFVAEHEGTPLRSSIAKVVVTAKEGTPVHILSLDVVDVAMEPAPAGTLILIARGGQGGEDIYLDYNLDRPDLGFVDRGSGERYFDSSSILLNEGDRAVFDLDFLTRSSTRYTWLISVTYLDEDNAEHVAYIDRKGDLHESIEDAGVDARFTLAGEAASYTTTFESNRNAGATGYSLVAPGSPAD